MGMAEEGSILSISSRPNGNYSQFSINLLGMLLLPIVTERQFLNS